MVTTGLLLTKYTYNWVFFKIQTKSFCVLVCIVVVVHQTQHYKCSDWKWIKPVVPNLYGLQHPYMAQKHFGGTLSYYKLVKKVSSSNLGALLEVLRAKNSAALWTTELDFLVKPAECSPFNIDCWLRWWWWFPFDAEYVELFNPQMSRRLNFFITRNFLFPILNNIRK